MAEASSDSGYVDNWQTGKTVTECNLHMLTTEDCSDVIFHVGSEKHVVRAHRYVLVSRSCVFHAMFCGPLAEKGEVTIPDIEPSIFREFLRYLYAEIADITADNVTGLLYTSRKYAVDTLQNQCASFLEKSLSEENVCQILEQCHGYGEEDLEQKALKILTEAGENVIKSAGFLDLCSTCFEKFLKSDELNVKEEDVFDATLSWAKKKCRKENLNSSQENLRKVLGQMVYEVRFMSFSTENLATVVESSEILIAEERVRFYDRNFKPGVDVSPFKSSPRKKSSMSRTLHYVNRCSKGWAGKQGVSCSRRKDAITFSTNRNITLVGCQLFGPCTLEESIYSLHMLLLDDQNQVIAEPIPISDRILRGLKEVNDIMFPDPVPLVAGLYYTIFVIMTGDHINYGFGRVTSVESDGVEFTFKDKLQSPTRELIRSLASYGDSLMNGTINSSE